MEMYEENIQEINIGEFGYEALYGSEDVYGLLDQIVFNIKNEEICEKSMLKDVELLKKSSNN